MADIASAVCEGLLVMSVAAGMAVMHPCWLFSTCAKTLAAAVRELFGEFRRIFRPSCIGELLSRVGIANDAAEGT
jgi:hypothetical protein